MMRLAQRLVDRGDEVGVLSLLPSEAYTDELAALGIPIVHAPNRRHLRGAAYIGFARSALRHWQPDLVLSFLYQANLVTRVGGRVSRVPTVVSSIRNERLGHRGRDVAMRITDRLATVSVTNSASVARTLAQNRVAPRDRLIVIPNGLDLDEHDRSTGDGATTRRALGLRPEQMVWLAIGRLEPQKDQHTLLSAFAQHVGEHPDATLLIAGDGRLRAELATEAQRLGVADSVSFLGIRNDVPSLLGAADAFIQSSAWEGLPNTVIEAMAASLPVVATRVGGTEELVTEGETGFLVAARDGAGLATAMDRLAGLTAEARGAMGARGRQVVEAGYTFDVAAQHWLDLIDALTARRHHAARRRQPMIGDALIRGRSDAVTPTFDGS